MPLLFKGKYEMKKFTIAAIACMIASSATAQSVNSGSESAALSQSGVTVNGSNIPDNTPGLGGSLTNSTAPCVIGTAFGIVGPGAGVNFGNGRINQECVIRVEAQILGELLSQPATPARQAQIAHLCANDESFQETLTAAGFCQVQTPTQPTVSSRSVPRDMLRTCSKTADGRLKVTVRSGATEAEKAAAVATCSTR